MLAACGWGVPEIWLSDFLIYLIVININGPMWLVAAILDSANLGALLKHGLLGSTPHDSDSVSRMGPKHLLF